MCCCGCMQFEFMYIMSSHNTASKRQITYIYSQCTSVADTGFLQGDLGCEMCSCVQKFLKLKSTPIFTCFSEKFSALPCLCGQEAFLCTILFVFPSQSRGSMEFQQPTLPKSTTLLCVCILEALIQV